MRVLLTGATGFIGSDLLKAWSPTHEIRPKVGQLRMDFRRETNDGREIWYQLDSEEIKELDFSIS